MNVRRLITGAVFLLLALAIHPRSTLSHQRIAESSERVSRPQLAQSLALADLAADGLVDEAEVTQPDASNQETAIDPDTIWTLDQTINDKRLDETAIELPNDYPGRLVIACPVIGQPAGRDPPLPLS